MKRVAGLLCVLVLCQMLRGTLLWGQTSEAGGGDSLLARAAEWELEQIRLQDGQALEGLILEDAAGKLQFVEIVRRPGAPMYAVRRWLPARRIVQQRRLDGEARQQLLARYRSFRHRTRIELGRREDVRLGQALQDGVTYHTFQGEGFSLWSTADEEMTRRCAVRIEQIVRAYHQLLPPRSDIRAAFHVRLYGSMDDYHGYLQRLGLEIDNPAFYSASQNMIVAGSDLTRYAERLAEIRRDNAALLRRYDRELNPQFDLALVRLSKELKRRGLGLEEIEQRRAAWEREYQATLRRVTEVNRRNEAKFAAVARRMFRRLYHEAFHAYLENHVYPHRRHDTPRWLNEGLAQIFEDGRLEADTLRVDAAAGDRLQRLQADLAARGPFRLTELLSADEQSFLVPHASSSSERHYLYSWGLAYYLTFYQDLLGRPELGWYVSLEAGRLDPVSRFERLVDMPLEAFQTQWRTFMSRLRPAG